MRDQLALNPTCFSRGSASILSQTTISELKSSLPWRLSFETDAFMDPSKDSQSRWRKTMGLDRTGTDFPAPFCFELQHSPRIIAGLRPEKPLGYCVMTQGGFVHGQQHCHLRQIKLA